MDLFKTYQNPLNLLGTWSILDYEKKKKYEHTIHTIKILLNYAYSLLCSRIIAITPKVLIRHHWWAITNIQFAQDQNTSSISITAFALTTQSIHFLRYPSLNNYHKSLAALWKLFGISHHERAISYLLSDQLNYIHIHDMSMLLKM